MHERDPNIVTSSLYGVVTEQGVTVRVNIIRLENEPGWSLEVENEHGTSTVWDDLFATDDAAHVAFRQTVDEEGLRAFLDQAVVIPFRR
ncbi:hypothetical protein ACFQS6_17700 [Xanthomonas populi]|uniref:Uncharacterized protein n=1 Tax=Xanthomonas populi TaxID=53414 RepID=A0A2S7ENF9_9XANT|nr:hypothetical protein [Xanthomonas populi]PPU93049.1 hypothetical protein XpopCFBP1817_11345 [Xanthomonas populi]